MIALVSRREIVKDLVEAVVRIGCQDTFILDQALVDVGHFLQRQTHRRFGDQRRLAVLIHSELDVRLFHLRINNNNDTNKYK